MPGSPRRSRSASIHDRVRDEAPNDAGAKKTRVFLFIPLWVWGVIGLLFVIGLFPVCVETSIVDPAASATQLPMHDISVNMPTVAEIRASIRRYGKAGNNTVFWSGDIRHMDDFTLAKTFDPTGCTLETCLAPDDRERWGYFQRASWKCAYWKRVAVALAEESSGVVHAIRWGDRRKQDGPGYPWEHDLFFHFAYPALMRNNKVDRVLVARIDTLTCGEDFLYYPIIAWRKGDDITYGPVDPEVFPLDYC